MTLPFSLMKNINEMGRNNSPHLGFNFYSKSVLQAKSAKPTPKGRRRRRLKPKWGELFLPISLIFIDIYPHEMGRVIKDKA